MGFQLPEILPEIQNDYENSRENPGFSVEPRGIEILAEAQPGRVA